ncbi:MAG: cobalamin biosynthesis protein, partial [Catenulispora sp.]|nr:cobalamin biosynthesis protein [Catenulispora sp.]
PAVGGSPLRTLRVLRRDGGRHPSPNAGRCEASAAGALGVRLGGTNTYGEVVEHRPVMGSGRAPRVADIRRASVLSAAVGLVSVAASVTVSVAASAAGSKAGSKAGSAAGPKAGSTAGSKAAAARLASAVGSRRR